MPVTVLGTAVSFYLGFKGNAAYDRMWEARKIWGGIVNASRSWGAHVTSFVHHERGQEEVKSLQKELVYRHIAWLQALRTQLRRLQPWEHARGTTGAQRDVFGTKDTSPKVLCTRMAPFLSAEELHWVMARKNQATQVLHRQSQQLAELKRDGLLNDFGHIELAELIQEFYTLQGKCERIKNFPLPRHYSTVTRWFVMVFLLLVPLALADTFASRGLASIWGAVPTSMMIFWVFILWEFVIEFTENPFEGLLHDIPMNSLSRTIEIDLREMLGEDELPPELGAVDHVVM